MKRYLLFVVPVLVVAIALGAAWYLKLISLGPPTAKEKPSDPGSIPYTIPERVVNLADKNGTHYLKIQMTLEYADPAHKPGELTGDALVQQESALTLALQPYDPAIQDFLITTLTSQAASDLLSTSGKEKLRQELLDGLKPLVPSQHLQAVYFTEFVIQ